MRKRSTGVITVVVLAGVAVVTLLLLGKVPALLEAWGALASRVSSLALAPAAPPSAFVASDAGGWRSDAATSVHRQPGPLSSAQLGAPLVHAPFISACGAPDDMKVVVDATVKMGRAVAVAVRTYPPNAIVGSCVDRATRNLQWDVSPKTDHVTVTY